jgi:hypothetical protein
MAKRFQAPPPLEERQFGSAEEIDLAVKKLERRIQELRNLNVPTAVSRQVTFARRSGKLLVPTRRSSRSTHISSFGPAQCSSTCRMPPS